MTLTIDFAAVGPYLLMALFGAVALFIVWQLAVRVRSFFASRQYDRSDLEAMRRRWQDIEAMLKTPGEMSLKMAVLEADKLLDQALKHLAMAGMTLGERLKFAAYKYPQLSNVWWAHRVRNQLAHEASYHLDRGLAVKALKAYKAALRLIGAI